MVVASSAVVVERPKAVHVPVVNFPRADVVLRGDLQLLLDQWGGDGGRAVAADALLFREDFDALMASGKPATRRIVLVDHNALGGEQREWAVRFPSSRCTPHDTDRRFPSQHLVSGVIDHHVEEGLFPGSSPHLVRAVGSCWYVSALHSRSSSVLAHAALAPFCSSLVGQLCLEADSALTAEERFALLTVIRLDTIDLEPAPKGRATAVDTDVAGRLQVDMEGFVAASPWDSWPSVYAAFLHARISIDGLAVGDLLRKDYKEWATANGFRYGIASVPGTPLAVLNNKQDGSEWTTVARDFADSRELGILLLLFAEPREGGMCRHFGWCLPSPDMAAHPTAALLLAGLEANEDIALQPYAEWNDGQGDGMRLQGNAAYSRKKLQPVIAQVLGTL